MFGLSVYMIHFIILLVLFYFRPVGRKSLEKLQRSTGGKSMMSVKVGQSMSFDPDIPENSTSKLANKFIPMQLRTQPSNLGMGQLQRVNTTLLGEISPGIAVETCTEARIFLLVDLQEFFFRLKVGGTKKNKNKKALKMTS